MPDTARPWPCYPTAHLGDKELARCSLAAEGLLWRMCSISATGEPFGYLTAGDGKPYTLDDLVEAKAASVLRGRESATSIGKALDELLAEGRVRQEPDGRYYIPKMVRIGEARTKAVADGRKGGNPALVGDKPPETHKTAPKTALTDAPLVPIPPQDAAPATDKLKWTLADCQAAAQGIGMSEAQVLGFWAHYAPVNFVDGAGRQIVSLQHALAKWKAREHEHKPVAQVETDKGILDYARQYRKLVAASNGDGIEALRRKARDNYGPDGWARVTRAAKEMR
jgi:hypothetical protein